jgi:hypothetical protein
VREYRTLGSARGPSGNRRFYLNGDKSTYMNFVEHLQAFFKAKKNDDRPVAVRDAFSLARTRYEQSQEASKSYTLRAKHRIIIMRARYRCDETKDTDAYEREIAAYTDPADFAPYTETELDEHTTRVERLAADFAVFSSAFTTLKSVSQNHDGEFYVVAQGCFNLYGEAYKMAVEALKMAALSAMSTAATAKAEAVKAGAKAWLKDIAKNPEAEVKTTETEIRAERLREKAVVAGAKADAFLATAKEILGE